MSWFSARSCALFSDTRTIAPTIISAISAAIALYATVHAFVEMFTAYLR